jgi:hypothetical protein
MAMQRLTLELRDLNSKFPTLHTFNLHNFLLQCMYECKWPNISGIQSSQMPVQSKVRNPTTVKVVLKGYRIRRASASAHMLCPFPEYSPLFQNTIRIVSEDPDGYCSVSEGPDDYRMISGCRDK